MGTLNVGSMAARLGLDPADFLDKMKGVQGFNGFVSSEMARQWKKTGRDGQEGIRLIDEALGIHVARPVARIVSETFPALSKAISGILPGVAFSALGFAIFEFAEKAVEKIQKAQKAVEEFGAASAKVESTLQQIGEGWAVKIAGLQNRNGQSALNAEGAKEARKDVEEYMKALDEMQKKQEAASGWITKSLAAIGNEWHSVFASDSTKLFEQGQQDLERLGRGLQDAFNFDVMHGTDTALRKINDDIANIQDRIEAAPFLRSFAEQLPNLQKEADYLATIKTRIVDMEEAWKKADAAAAGRKAAEEAQKKLLAFYQDLASSMKKLNPESDPIAKMHAEINSFRSEAVTAFVAVGDSAANSLQIRGAHKALESYLALLEQAKHRLESDILATQAAELLSKPIPGIGTETPTKGFELANPPQIPAPQVSAFPTLGPGGTAGAQFDTFAASQGAQMKMAAQAFEDALGPQQKYKLVEQELDLLLQKKLIDQNAYNAALAQAISLKSREGKQGLGGEVDAVNAGGGRMQELQQRSSTLQAQLTSGTALDGTALNPNDIAAVKLAIQGITDEEDKILLKTGDVNAGIKAWADSMQQVKTAGTFVFEELTQATKGFEDDAVKSFTDILEVQRGQHQKMINELRKMWANYFTNLAQEALKHQLDKLLAPVAGKIGGIFGTGGGPQAAATTANTSALGTLTGAVTALTARMTVSGAGGLGAIGAAGNVGEAGYAGNAGDFAEGGDVTPGSSFISGEAGAEEVDLDRSGGAHITPLGAGGGATYHQYDMRGAVVTDDLMRKADAAKLLKHAEPAFIGKALANFSEVQRRTPQR
jgi:hypothetical protein